MGAGLARNALTKGYAVTGLDTRVVPAALKRNGLQAADDMKALAKLLPPPRLVMLYVPAGPPVDAVLTALEGNLAAGDIVVDGGNSYWGDSIRRHARLKQTSIHFIDAGTSVGPGGAHDGACSIVGGEDAPIAIVEPVLRALAVEGGYVGTGGPGTGHFVKLVDNGIEFGMLQAIGEAWICSPITASGCRCLTSCAAGSTAR